VSRRTGERTKAAEVKIGKRLEAPKTTRGQTLIDVKRAKTIVNLTRMDVRPDVTII